MDPTLDVLYGPSPIQKIGTVTVPKELLMEVGLVAGERVHWALNPDLPGTLLLVPAAMVARVMPETLEALRKAAT